MKKLLFFLILVTAFSCGDDNKEPVDPTPVDNFDRQAMLAHWADNYIIPAYTFFGEKTKELKSAGDAFADDPTEANYDFLVTKWELAYASFQDVSMIDIGKAEEIRFTNNLNIYPSDVAGIDANAMNGDFNLDLPSEIDKQGFPALDYLLFGVESGREQILDFYQNASNAGAYLTYLRGLVARIDDLTQLILQDWTNGFRDKFVNNSGNSATASVDKLVNDFIYYYEKHLRAGKVGIPAGVFSGSPLSAATEAYYRQDYSKFLLNRALDAVQNFFTHANYDGSSPGLSMKDYLDYLEVKKGEEDLSQVIIQQFNAAHSTISELNDNLALQVQTDNFRMLAAYDQLQLNVVNIKVDMLQAFNVNVDYVDADGD